MQLDSRLFSASGFLAFGAGMHAALRASGATEHVAVVSPSTVFEPWEKKALFISGVAAAGYLVYSKVRTWTSRWAIRFYRIVFTGFRVVGITAQKREDATLVIITWWHRKHFTLRG